MHPKRTIQRSSRHGTPTGSPADESVGGKRKVSQLANVGGNGATDDRPESGSGRQLTPLHSCTQDPQDSVENRSRFLPRTTSTIGAPLRSQDRFNQLPLSIAEFPSSSHALFLTAFYPENSTVGSTIFCETSCREELPVCAACNRLNLGGAE
jgi:hypothetical protein